MLVPHVVNNDRARQFEIEVDGQVGFLRYRFRAVRSGSSILRSRRAFGAEDTRRLEKPRA